MTKERFRILTASYLMLLKEDKILLSRRFNTGWEDGNYSLPSGHIEGGESVRAALRRETLEETGLVLDPKDVVFAHVMHRRSDLEYIDFFFTVTRWKGEPTNTEPHKCDDLSWFSLKSLPKNTIPHVVSALKNWQKGISFSEFNWPE